VKRETGDSKVASRSDAAGAEEVDPTVESDEKIEPQAEGRRLTMQLIRLRALSDEEQSLGHEHM
jgi:hypothetical protein